MIRTQVYLNDQQYNLAKLYTDQSEISFSEAIREGLDMWLEKWNDKLHKSGRKRKKAFDDYIGIIKTGGKPGSSTAAIDHNKVLYEEMFNEKYEE